MINDIFRMYEEKLIEQEIEIPVKIKIEFSSGAGDSNSTEELPDVVAADDEGISIDDIEQTCDELSDDERILAAIDDYFKTLNDGQYSPMSGEHNNSGINTEVYMISRKHGIDPAKLFSHLNDTMKFDKFQKISASGVPQISENKKIVEYTDLIDKARGMYVKHMKPDAYKKHVANALKVYSSARKVRGDDVWRGIAQAYKLDPREFKKAIDMMDKANKNVILPESHDEIDRDIHSIDRILRKDGTMIDCTHPLEKNDLGGYTVIGKNGVKYDFDAECNVMKKQQVSLGEGYAIVPAIDREKYPNREREGLEGPYRNKHGRVYYYDVKAGRYYDPNTDMFFDVDDIMEKKLKPLEESVNRFVSLMEGKKMSVYEGRLKLILEKLGVDYLEKDGHIFVAEPYFSKIRQKFPDLSGVMRERRVCNESCTSGGTCSGSVASVSIPMGTIQKRVMHETKCSCGCSGGGNCKCGPECCEKGCFCRKK